MWHGMHMFGTMHWDHRDHTENTNTSSVLAFTKDTKGDSCLVASEVDATNDIPNTNVDIKVSTSEAYLALLVYAPDELDHSVSGDESKMSISAKCLVLQPVARQVADGMVEYE